MTEKPKGETPQLEQKDKNLIINFESILSRLEEGAHIISIEELLNIFEEAGENELILELFKIGIDNIIAEFNQALKDGDERKLGSVVGHMGMHAAAFLRRNKSKIPNESGLYEIMNDLTNLQNIYYTESLGNAQYYYEDIGLNGQAKKVLKARQSFGKLENLQEAIDLGLNPNTTNEQFQSMQLEYEKLRTQLVKEETERICNLYAEPMIDPDQRKAIIAKAKEKLREMLS